MQINIKEIIKSILSNAKMVTSFLIVLRYYIRFALITKYNTVELKQVLLKTGLKVLSSGDQSIISR